MFCEYIIYLSKQLCVRIKMQGETLLIDNRTYSLIEKHIPSNDVLESIACFFSVFSDITRVKIIVALSLSEMCVTDIAKVLNINQTTVSHQLRFLKNYNIVKAQRQGRVVFYAISSECVNEVMLKCVEFLGY